MPVPGSEWVNREQIVRASATVRVAAPTQAVLALLRRPDAPLFGPGVVDVVRVPGSPLLITVVVSATGVRLDLQQVLPPSDDGVSWHSLLSRVTTSVKVEPARGGCRVRVTLARAVGSRAEGRPYLDWMEQAARAWLETVPPVATGFRPFPERKPRAVVELQPALPADTAHLVADRTLAVPIRQVWDALLGDGPTVQGVRGFRTGGPSAGVGDVHWLVGHVGESRAVSAGEIVSLAPGRSLTVRRLAAASHPARTSWQLEPADGGTRVHFDHECATSHVGLADEATTALALLGHQVGLR